MDDRTTQEKLLAPFEESEIEWRISRCMNTKLGPKATVLAYITSRAVMDRLDDVFGIEGWQDKYDFVGEDVVCSLSVKFEHGWITKVDGAPQTNVESFKGGISDALKRAAVKYGIGRYLYGLSESWVDIQKEKPTGSSYKYVNDKKAEVTGYWFPPSLPSWALPVKTGVGTKDLGKLNKSKVGEHVIEKGPLKGQSVAQAAVAGHLVKENLVLMSEALSDLDKTCIKIFLKSKEQ